MLRPGMAVAQHRIRRRTLHAAATASSSSHRYDLADSSTAEIAALSHRDHITNSPIVTAAPNAWETCKSYMTFGWLPTARRDRGVWAAHALCAVATATQARAEAKDVAALLSLVCEGLGTGGLFKADSRVLEAIKHVDPLNALPLCGTLVSFVLAHDIVMPVSTLVAIGEACQRAARHHKGDKGSFGHVLPKAARCVAITESRGAIAVNEMQSLNHAARALLGVARLAPWPTPLLVLDQLPQAIASDPYVMARCLGSAAFAFRHLLATPGSNLNGIPMDRIMATSLSDDVKRLTELIQMIIARTNDSTGRLSRTIDSVLAEGVRHGVAALLSLGAVAAASRATRELETALEMTAYAKSPNATAAPTPVHWTQVEVRCREGNLLGAVDACKRLGASRAQGWAAVPSVVVDCVSRLASACGGCRDAPSLLLPLLVAAASFRSNDALPQAALLGAFMDAFTVALTQSVPRDAVSSVTTMATALADVIPLVPLEVAWAYIDAVLKLPPTIDGSLRAAAVWRLLQCTARTDMGAALSQLTLSATDASDVLRHVPQLATDRIERQRRRNRVPSMDHVWTCIACSTSHGSASSSCLGCGAPRFHAAACGSCNHRVGPTLAMCQPEVHGCVLCGRDGTPGFKAGACRACGKAATGELYCTSCGETADFIANRITPTLWQCHVCSGWSAWSDESCRHCMSWMQLPVSPRLSWEGHVRAVPCSGCPRQVLLPLDAKCHGCGTTCDASPAQDEAEATPTRTVFLRPCEACFHCEDAATGGTAQGTCSKCGVAALSGRPICHSPWTCAQCRQRQPDGQIGLLCVHCDALSPKRPVELLFYMATARQALSIKDLGRLASVVSTVATALVSVESGSTRTPPVSMDSINSVIVPLIAHAAALAGDLATRPQRRLATVAHALGAFASIDVLSAGRCPHCAATHPEALCPERPDPTWTCEECGHVGNHNKGATRYVCQGCMQVRRIMFELEWSDAWECDACSRVTCESDDACAHCGEVRSTNAASNAAYALPFFPARCAACGEVHLEALCPVCHRDDSVREELVKGQAMAALDHLHDVTALGLHANGDGVTPIGETIDGSSTTATVLSLRASRDMS